MKITAASAFLGGIYFVLVILWFTGSLFDKDSSIQAIGIFSGIKTAPYNYIYAFIYGILPILGGIFGYMKAERWGYFKSSMGKALVFLSTGLVTWGLGEMIWSFYNFFLAQEIPYPSLADVFFIVSWPLWTIGVFYLAQATGAK